MNKEASGVVNLKWKFIILLFFLLSEPSAFKKRINKGRNNLIIFSSWFK